MTSKPNLPFSSFSQNQIRNEREAPAGYEENGQRRFVREVVDDFLSLFLRENEIAALREGSNSLHITLNVDAEPDRLGAVPFRIAGEYKARDLKIRVNFDDLRQGTAGNTNEIHVSRDVPAPSETPESEPMHVQLDCIEVDQQKQAAELSCELELGDHLPARLAFPVAGGVVELACGEEYLDAFARELTFHLGLVRAITKKDLQALDGAEKPLPEWAKIVEFRLRNLLFTEHGGLLAEHDLSNGEADFVAHARSEFMSDDEMALLREHGLGCLDTFMHETLSDSELEAISGWTKIKPKISGRKHERSMATAYLEAEAGFLDADNDRHATVELNGVFGKPKMDKTLTVARNFEGSSRAANNRIVMRVTDAPIEGRRPVYEIEVTGEQSKGKIEVDMSQDPAVRINNTGDIEQELGAMLGETVARALLYKSDNPIVLDAALAVIRAKLFEQLES
jgi:hypothetical protein